MLPNNKICNIIVTGCGGQGVLTLAEILAKAAQKSGAEVKEAELHGLSQRGGPLECHLRFGQQIYSPLIRRADADLIIGLELLETLRACYYASKDKTIILGNDRYLSPDPAARLTAQNKKIRQDLKKFCQQLYLVDVDDILAKNNLNLSLINTFMLGVLVEKNILPIKKEYIWQAIREKIKPQFWAENEKVFNLAQEI